MGGGEFLGGRRNVGGKWDWGRVSLVVARIEEGLGP